MNYDENVFKEKANIKARRIWLVFALLLTANYGSDAANGLYPFSNYFCSTMLGSFLYRRYSAAAKRKIN